MSSLPSVRSWLVVAALWVYTAAIAAWLGFGWGGPATTALVASWSEVPAQLPLLGLLATLLRNPRIGLQRRVAWWLFALGVAANLLAATGWALVATTGGTIYGNWADSIYMLYYPLTVGGCLVLFADCGGSLRRPRVWLDAAALALALGATLWLSIFEPLTAASSAAMGASLATVGYGIGDAMVGIAAALLFTQIMDWRSERSTMWVIASIVTVFVTDLVWVSAAVKGAYLAGAMVDVGYCIGYALLAVGVVFEQGRQVAANRERPREGNAYSFLPVLAVLLAIMLLVSQQFGLRHATLLVAFVLVGAALVVARQLLTRREISVLNRELATRNAEARLTELVRRSSDVIAVIDAANHLAYVSPAAERVLGRNAESLRLQPVALLLGPGNQSRVDAFLADVTSGLSELSHMEIEYSTPDGERRMLQVTGSDQRQSPAIEGLTLTIRDVTENKRLEEQLRSLAFYDPLTLLANRSLFADRVHHAVGRIRDGLRPAVLFIDLDNFKTINDSLGHGAGDRLLRTCAQRIVQGTRASDTVARLGGDEFAVLIDDTPGAAAALTVANHVLKSLIAPVDIDGRELRVSASIGICLSNSQATAEHLLRNADAAMYRAKALGKNQAVIFETEMLKAARRRLQIEHELAAALERNELLVHYQPIVDLRSTHLIGIEALMRWQHPTRGIVMPDEFIPIAEETGHIVPMTQWILRRACFDTAQLKRGIHLGDGLRISVNISGRYLQHATMVEDIGAAIRDSGLDAGSLVLEVTESILLQEGPELERRLAALKALGVRLALDDFGTGYSSLAYLHRFPLDVLKIDRSFIQKLSGTGEEQQGDATVLAKAILSLADALGLDTVAEGIEVEAQRDALLALGCQTGQGYTFGMPMPLDELLTSHPARRREVLAENLVGPIEFTATGRFRRIVTPNSSSGSG
jgi:diguanylate cyclase (GGDEF)-like protein/PAS domain S-box-containing protein